MKNRPLTASPAYRQFVKSRNQALEVLLDNALLDISDALGIALSRVEDSIHSAAMKIQNNFFNQLGSRIFQDFEQKVKHAFAGIAPAIALRVQKMNSQSYLLAYVGEKEAIGRAKHEPQKYTHPKSKTTSIASQDEPLGARVELSLWRLQEKILQAFKLAQIQELPASEFVDKVKAAFPKKKKLPERNTVLLSNGLREAALGQTIRATVEGKKAAFSFGVLDEDEWAEIADQITSGLPTYAYRTPEMAPEKYYVPSKGKEVYLWEMEQEATQNFVDEVRSGQTQAAEDSGIKDFVWVAIMDDKTDECCAWRDGLTTDEIKSRLSGDKKGDDCDAIVPPAHFNCRCDVVPLSENVNEVSPPSAERFDEWLRS